MTWIHLNLTLLSWLILNTPSQYKHREVLHYIRVDTIWERQALQHWVITRLANYKDHVLDNNTLNNKVVNRSLCFAQIA